ncbi:MAG: type IV pilus modification PilV family protein [Elainellaceae cyanobacterium]
MKRSALNHPIARHLPQMGAPFRSQSSRMGSSEAGLTLLECIVSIVVVAITGALITPPLFLATATRLQNQRSDQALQIAQGEVDHIRTLTEQSRHYPTALPAVGPANTASVQAYALPDAIASQLKSVNTGCADLYDGAQIPPTTLLPIDVDGDCESDFLMQFFRTPGVTSTRETTSGTNRPTAFKVGVRVYARNAGDNLGNLYRDPDTGGVVPASLKFTSGEGNQRERPLAVQYTQVTWGDTEFSLCQYHDQCS